MNLKNMRECGD